MAPGFYHSEPNRVLSAVDTAKARRGDQTSVAALPLNPSLKDPTIIGTHHSGLSCTCQRVLMPIPPYQDWKMSFFCHLGDACLENNSRGIVTHEVRERVPEVELRECRSCPLASSTLCLCTSDSHFDTKWAKARKPTVNLGRQPSLSSRSVSHIDFALTTKE